MSEIDSRRLPYKALMKDAQREAERKAELYAVRHLDDVRRAKSGRGVRHRLRRLRDSISRRS